MAEELAELVVTDATALRGWLGVHLDDDAGVWLVLARKGTTDPTTLSYAEAVDEGLCHGWIDGQGRKRDDETYTIRFTPRRARSIWSKRNVGLVERLEREGRMTTRGRSEVDKAKADGRWAAAYAGSEEIEVPDDLLEALASEPVAQAWWEVLTKTNRYAVLHRLHTAQRPETRQRRLAKLVAQLAEGETPYPQRARPD